METTMIKRNSEQNNKAKAYPPKKASRPINLSLEVKKFLW